MAKPKFNLTAVPTFKADVSIPVPGGKSVNVEFTFKHRGKGQFREFVEGLSDREDIDVIKDIASGWELEESFDAENIEKMAENYIGSTRAIIETYMRELSGARAKN
ncbi:phage tail assembly chaperone [Janthinobacterium sp. P210005]|uniref:phage tail assembly chaperone n=1 Tax=Janthinobacterium sp. P210005 TaxID=3112938 RepID=UPI002E25AE5A|nr:phage tail assembly chaperone [Janthinobacterium sp. P210005]